MYIYIKKKNSINLSTELVKILNHLQVRGARPLLVGGCVRDHFLKNQIKDYDIEVFDIKDFNTLTSYLKDFGEIKLVGKSFGVLKLLTKNDEYDFALPRIEKKISSGHKGFEIISDASLDYKQAASRRDFTINSIAYDFKTKDFLDPFNGLQDIKDKKLKYINIDSFKEDPLRVYRAIGFLARFDFTIDFKTKELCIEMVKGGELKTLAKERIFEEFKKFLLKAKKPSIAFKYLREFGLLEYFTELKALVSCKQDKIYHPEGDVWIHTLLSLDEMAKLRTKDEKKNLLLMLAILCHDLGKPYCTKEIKGRITSYKHESLGLEPTKSFLDKLCDDKKLCDEVCTLVKYHLIPFAFFLSNPSSKAIKRLATKVNIEDLCKVCLADCLGRDIKDKEKCPQAIKYLLEEAKKLEVHNVAEKNLVQGRDLLFLGFKAGKEFKTILEFAYNLQIDESKDKNEILEEIKKHFNRV